MDSLIGCIVLDSLSGKVDKFCYQLIRSSLRAKNLQCARQLCDRTLFLLILFLLSVQFFWIFSVIYSLPWFNQTVINWKKKDLDVVYLNLIEVKWTIPQVGQN